MGFLSGCATHYEYQPVSPQDPVITFGDRLGGGAIFYSPTRSFSINTTGTNQCADYHDVGSVSNHWTRIYAKTRKYFVPKETKVSLIGNYSLATGNKYSSCKFGPISFKAEASKHYSVDISTLFTTCSISIFEIAPDGTYLNIQIEQNREPECVR
ncbi:hypothetical protein [Shewanella surugensis]|uniref:Lipoprotein n=1 Tax=Shewanella surugensis TaxID=212020 RepID=A0ABT0L7L4_9GAMM|nr:hypothetical protein [Shewanella surugensis]MCL1123385.1 hypothetical protein [Shewanella surugensis]